MKGKFVRLAILALLLAMFSGCVRETVDGDTRIFGYEYWVTGLVFLAGVVATPVGWALRDKASRFGWALVILGPVASLGFAPSLLLDRVEVRPNGFSRHSGIWGMTAVQEVDFADVHEMHIVTREERGRRGRRVMRTYLVCDLKSADDVEVPASNDVAREAMPHIAQAAEGKGILVNGL